MGSKRGRIELCGKNLQKDKRTDSILLSPSTLGSRVNPPQPTPFTVHILDHSPSFRRKYFRGRKLYNWRQHGNMYVYIVHAVLWIDGCCCYVMANCAIISLQPASTGCLDADDCSPCLKVHPMYCIKNQSTLWTTYNLQSEANKATETRLIPPLSRLFSGQPRFQTPFSPCLGTSSVNSPSGVYSLYTIRSEHFQTKEKGHSEGSKMKRRVFVWWWRGLTSSPLFTWWMQSDSKRESL